MKEMDTIAQIVTAPGRGAVGIVRISGRDAVAIAATLYDGKADLTQGQSHTIHYGWVRIPGGERLDEALFMLMRAPRTYTGEDVVEIQCHGGPVATSEVLRQVLAAGARAAEEGEFSQRAFLNGKLDLTRAEAIMDLVDARSRKALCLAAEQKNGRLADAIDALRGDCLTLIAYLQADLDYPEDDIERLDDAQMQGRAAAIETGLRKLIASGERGRLYKEGLAVAIAGRPNVGKSSLLNALVGRDSAIVTDIPGTTRDVVREHLLIRGIPVEILDTAGLRATDDEVEAIGVARAKATAREADIVIYVVESEEGLRPDDVETLSTLPPALPLILVGNKSDLHPPQLDLPEAFDHLPVVPLSARTGAGLEALEDAIHHLAVLHRPPTADDFYVTNSRHLALLETAASDLAHFQEALAGGIPEDLLVIDLQHTWESLGLITGETAAEDILDEIFANFCLGK